MANSWILLLKVLKVKLCVHVRVCVHAYGGVWAMPYLMNCDLVRVRAMWSS